MRTLLHVIPLSLAVVSGAFAQNVPAAQPDVSLVRRALAEELRAVQDTSHPMRYQLRRTSPRLTTTKEMIETRDGVVAMLISVNDKPLSASDKRKEQARLNGLLADAGKQRHRKQAQEADTARAMKVLRALPDAFTYVYAGPLTVGATTVQRFAFTPNPGFDPPDLETQVLTSLIGEIWIDPVHGRVLHLEGHLRDDVDFGWGILGRLYKGGWITIDQADVGGGVWRIVRFQMDMTGRMLIRTRRFVTTEEESHYSPVPVGLDYREGIAILRRTARVTPLSAPLP